MIFEMINNEEMEEAFILDNHGKRVGILAFALASFLGMSEDDQAAMYIAGRWHDLGKIKIPLDILNKRGRLDLEEELLVRMHPIYSTYIARLKGLPEFVLETVLYHHEDFDGSGYPIGLKGTNIPLGARIVRICDTFDSLRESRPYRRALTAEEALEVMERESDKYDREIYEVFRKHYQEVDSYVEENFNIATRFIDWTSGHIPVLIDVSRVRNETG